jgi:hypothetical protein
MSCRRFSPSSECPVNHNFSLKNSEVVGTHDAKWHSMGMSRYRFITPHRRGKWYPDLKTAQRFAAKIGAGFLERRSGKFFPYRDTTLEVEPA